MESVAAATAIARRGLLDDCHAQPLGPRQVLVVRQEALDELGVAAWQVRANIAIRGLPAAAFESGRVLCVGEASVRITHACEICSVLRGYVDRETFRRLPGRRGALGVIIDGGAIRAGDAVRLLADRYPVVPDLIAERAAWIIARIPEGRVLTYDGLLCLAGGKRAHFRVVPHYVRRAVAAGLPAHRVVTSAAQLSRYVENQEALLEAEGVAVRDGVVDDHRAIWDGRTIFWRRR